MLEDEKNRERAKSRVVSINRGYWPKSRVIEENRLALESYSKIQRKIPADIRDMAALWRDNAILFFNSSKYEEAATYYLQSIEQLRQMESIESTQGEGKEELQDRDYRELIELYFDLSDCCLELHHQGMADESAANAIIAFNLIKTKTVQESALGDPSANSDSFQLFHTYFEKLSSNPGFLTTASFKNQELILKKRQEARQDEQGLVQRFGGIDLDSTNTIGAMMAGLGLANEAARATRPSFTPINLAQPVNDVDFRSLAIELLRLTHEHSERGNRVDTVATYQQALSVLNEIKFKTPNDEQVIGGIHNQIAYLKGQSISSSYVPEASSASEPLFQQNQPVASGLIAAFGMFPPHGARGKPVVSGRDDEPLPEDLEGGYVEDLYGMDCRL